MTPIAEGVEPVQFGQHLVCVLGAGLSSVKLDDVAEFAGERAAPGKLDADLDIVFEVQQVEPRGGGCRDIGLEFFSCEGARACTVFPGAQEFADHALGLADDAEIGLFIKFGAGRRVRPADGDGNALGAAGTDDLERIRLLRQHAAGQDDIRPLQIGVFKFRRIAVDEAGFPGFRQHSRNGDKPQRRSRIFRADQFAGLAVVPEGSSHEARMDQEGPACWFGHAFLSSRAATAAPVPTVCHTLLDFTGNEREALP